MKCYLVTGYDYLNEWRHSYKIYLVKEYAEIKAKRLELIYPEESFYVEEIELQIYPFTLIRNPKQRAL